MARFLLVVKVFPVALNLPAILDEAWTAFPGAFSPETAVLQNEPISIWGF